MILNIFRPNVCKNGSAACLAMRMDEGDARSGNPELTMHLTHAKTQREADGS